MSFAHDLVDRVKNTADVVQIIGEYIRLRKSGSNFIGLCPFHSEKTPSFHVHSARKFFYCFGCHAKGDVIKFLQLMEGLTFSDALRLLAGKYGIPVESQDPITDPKARERRILFEIHKRALQYFQNQLSLGREGRWAQQYLERRALSPQVIERFGLGYAPSQSDRLLQRLRADFSLDQLRLSGLIQRNEMDSHHYDRFRRRIIFPIQNESGKTVAFGGRALGDGQPKYLNSPETPIYSKSRTIFALSHARTAIRKEGVAILVEGYMDCIALHQAGVSTAIASCGTSLTEAQTRLLGRFTKKVVVNFDPDEAGSAATLRSLGILLDNGFNIRVLVLPDELDPDAYLRKNNAAAYQHLLQKAPTYFEYLLRRTQEGHSLETVEGKVAAVEGLLPYLVRVSNRIEREEKTKRVAEFFSIDENAIRAELRKAVHGGREKLNLHQSQLKAHLSPAERLLIKGILELDSRAGHIVDQLEHSQVYVGLESENIFQKIIALYRKDGRVDLERLQEALPENEECNFISETVFSEDDQPQISTCLEWLSRRKTKKEIVSLQKQIEQAERSQDLKLAASLHSRKAMLTLTVAG